jgi:hypothetical protein
MAEPVGQAAVHLLRHRERERRSYDDPSQALPRGVCRHDPESCATVAQRGERLDLYPRHADDGAYAGIAARLDPLEAELEKAVGAEVKP